VEIENLWKSGEVRIFAKLEGSNPGGSVKDRVAKYMIQQAIERGELKPGMEVLEATSGNTGIGLAMVCAALKYKCTLVMPKAVSEERKKILRAYGARLIEVDGATDLAITTVAEMMKTHGWVHHYNPNQFDNPDNWKTHYMETAPEIAKQLGEICYWTGHSPYMNPTHFVSAYGTTGTIRGCSAWFKFTYRTVLHIERYRTKIIAVSPQKNSKIQGLKNLQFQIVPKIHNPRYINETLFATDKEAFEMTRKLAKVEGIFCGMSSGAAMSQAIKVAKELKSGTIVVILADRGDRYLSTGVFA